tara:strand:+ start:19 stop:279 length:261 start_codon:yes stop_codon:yes gene_type:complete
MKAGDLVSKITNDWILNNKWATETVVAKELFGHTKEVFGIILEDPEAFRITRSGDEVPIATAKVLTTSGGIVNVSINQLEVIGSNE